VPTAELELVGARATLVSPPGRGVATISQLINITRLYNAISAVSGMRRIIALNRDYAHRRKVFAIICPLIIISSSVDFLSLI
jgi:acyl-CoA dehydrogenase